MKNLFWDSCILIRYFLNDDRALYFQDIGRFIDEAKDKAPKWRIHFSTISFAEIRPSHFRGDHRNLQEFFEDVGAAFSPIDPNPNVLIQTGALRDAPVTCPNPQQTNIRALATPDAILLMTCVYAKKFMEMKDIVFHSTDEGKGKSWAGKSVPIIGFERWYPEGTRTETVKDVCDLSRELPIHPQPMLPGISNVTPPLRPDASDQTGSTA